MAVDVTLAPQPFSAGDAYGRFAETTDGDGAIASFTGITRPFTAGGAAIRSLWLDHHPRLTLLSMQAIADNAKDRFKLTRLRVIHRCGAVAANDVVVFVAAAAPHRRAAFDAVDYVMDRLKNEAVFWKKEISDDGGRWIEPTDDDRAARERWNKNDGGH